MPGQLWRLTPAEISEIVEARMEAQMQEWRFFDTMNGLHLSMYAAAHGVEHATPRDYMITPAEPEKVPVVRADTPEEMQQKCEIMQALGLVYKTEE